MRRFVYYNSSYSDFKPFIIKVNSGADSEFTIPTTGGGYLYDVKTEDGQKFFGQTGNLTITFPATNTDYEIKIYGNFRHWYQFNNSEREKVVELIQWGDIEWFSMYGSFYGCTNLIISATDSPNVSSVTNVGNMFRDCTSLTALDVSNWDVGNVTNMSVMFYNCLSMTTPPDTSGWDTGVLTNTEGMFRNCISMTTPPDTSGWDTGVLTNTAYMFYDCQSMTTPPDTSGWDTGVLTNTGGMFYNCPFLTTLDVSNWDVSSVTNMGSMFQFCDNLISDIDFSDPTTGSISLTQISGMMAGTKSERLLLQAGNLQSPVNISGNPSNWIASPNMAEVKLFGMKNDVDTTIGLGGAGAMTGEAWKDLLESFDITQAKTYKLSVAGYNDMETHVQGLGYIDIQDYLTQTSNNWTVIN